MLRSPHWTLLPASAFDSAAGDWDAINRDAGNLPILDARFFTLLMQHFPPNRAAIVAVLRDDTRALCAGIFEPGRARTWQTYQPGQSPLGAWVCARDFDPNKALGGLFSTNTGRLSLGIGISQIDPELMPRPPVGSRADTLDYIESGTLMVSGPFDAYWEARGKNLRQNTRRQRSRFERDGVTTRLVECRQAAEVAAAVDEYGRIESRGWKGAEGSALHPDNVQGHFYRTMLADFATRGEAVVYQYRYGDDVVASDLCVARGGVLIILKTTYDEAHRNTSPAMLMHQELLQPIFDERRFRRIEFYGRLMEWHTRLTDDKKVLYHLNFFRFPRLRAVVAAFRRRR